MSLLVRPWLGCYQTCLPFLFLTALLPTPPPAHRAGLLITACPPALIWILEPGLLRCWGPVPPTFTTFIPMIELWSVVNLAHPCNVQVKTSSSSDVLNWPTCVFGNVSPSWKGFHYMTKTELQIWQNTNFGLKRASERARGKKTSKLLPWIWLLIIGFPRIFLIFHRVLALILL